MKAALVVRHRISCAQDLFAEVFVRVVRCAGVLALNENQVRQALEDLVVEAAGIDDGYRLSGLGVTRRHAFGIAAGKAAAPPMA